MINSLLSEEGSRRIDCSFLRFEAILKETSFRNDSRVVTRFASEDLETFVTNAAIEIRYACEIYLRVAYILIKQYNHYLSS